MIKVKAQDLNRIVSSVSHAIPKRPITVESGLVRLKTDYPRLYAYGTDTTILIKSWCDVETNSDYMDLLISPKDILNLTKYLDGDVSMSLDHNTLVIQGYGHARVATMEPELYPRIEEPDVLTFIPISSRQVKSLGLSCQNLSNLARDNSMHVYQKDERIYCVTTAASQWFSCVILESNEPAESLVKYDYLLQALKATGDGFTLFLGDDKVVVKGYNTICIFPTQAGGVFDGSLLHSFEDFLFIEIDDPRNFGRIIDVAREFSGVNGAVTLDSDGKIIRISSVSGSEFNKETGIECNERFRASYRAQILKSAILDAGKDVYLTLAKRAGTEHLICKVHKSENEFHLIGPMVTA